MASAWDKPANDGTGFNSRSFLIVGMDNNVYLKNSILDNWDDTIQLTKTGNYIWISQDFNGDFLVISRDNKLYYSPGLFINNIDNYRLSVTTITNSLTSFTPLLNINGYIGCTTDGKVLLFDNKKNYKITLTLTGYTGSKIVKAYAFNLLSKQATSNVCLNDDQNNLWQITVRDIKTTSIPVTTPRPTFRMFVYITGFKYIGGEYQNLWITGKQLGNVPVICVSALESWFVITKQSNKNLELPFCLTDGFNPDSDPDLFNSLKNSTIPIQPSLYHMLKAYPDASLFPYKFISLYDLIGLGKAKYIYSQVGTGDVSIAFDMYIMKFNLKKDKYFPLGDVILKHPFSGPNPDLTKIWIPLVYYDNKQIYSTILPDSTWINVKNNDNNYNDNEYQWGTCALAETNRLYNTQYISTGDCFTDTNTPSPGNQCAGIVSRPIAAVRKEYVIPTTIQPTEYTSTNYQIANLKHTLNWDSGAWGSRKGHSYNNYDIFTLTTPFNTFNITAQDFIWKSDYPNRVLPNKNKPGEIPDISTVEGRPPGYKDYPFSGKSYYWPTYMFGDLVPEFLLAIMCGDSTSLSKLNTVLPIQLSDTAKKTCSGTMSIFMQKDNYSNLSNLKSNQPIIDWCNNGKEWGGAGTCDTILTAFCTLGSDGKPVSKAETIIKNGPEWTTPKEILKIFPNSKNTDICGSFMPAPNYYAAMDYGEAKGNKALEAGVSQVLTGKGYNETSCTSIGAASEIYTSTNYPNMVQCPSIQICMNSVEFENMGTINGKVSLNLQNNCSQSTTPPPSTPPSTPPPSTPPPSTPPPKSNAILFVIIAVVVAIIAIIMFMKFR